MPFIWQVAVISYLMVLVVWSMARGLVCNVELWGVNLHAKPTAKCSCKISTGNSNWSYKSNWSKSLRSRSWSNNSSWWRWRDGTLDSTADLGGVGGVWVLKATLVFIFGSNLKTRLFTSTKDQAEQLSFPLFSSVFWVSEKLLKLQWFLTAETIFVLARHESTGMRCVIEISCAKTLYVMRYL